MNPVPLTGAGAPSTGSPSEWIRRWSHLVPQGATVLDVACGQGRHVRWFAERGHPVTGVDRSPDALAAMGDLKASVTLVEADIENKPWPLRQGAQLQQFDAVVVANYLWRPLLPTLLDSVEPGGVLLYETFSVDHAAIGRPSRPEFLLRHGELLEICQGWRIVAYEDGWMHQPQRFLQRVAALRPALGSGAQTLPATPLEVPLQP